ncbi:RHS repeat domain-containing protein [Streptomyces sp. NRRL S-378]|uniref:RHS repeat domain-containing protein n=1 Tax=Streptomyces sp. NRRL S-378 TaxID=1463904 RepID=UPI00068B8497|nr:RHS repeat-associated core domain-containing protein [Streptomyces sp. NRRL S-378]
MHSTLGRWLARGAVTLSLALLPPLLGPSLGATAAGNGNTFPEPTKPKIDKVVPFKKRNTKAPTDQADLAAERAKQAVAAAHWPSAGEVTLSAAPGKVAQRATGDLIVALRDGRQPAKAVSGIGAVERKDPRAITSDTNSVRVQVHDRKAAERAGVAGVLLGLTAAQAPAGETMQFSLDYSTFGSMYGGDYGTRLHLVQLPACALTHPERMECRTRRPIAGDNNTTAKTLTAEVQAKSLAAGPMLLAAEAGSSSSAGDYGATPLGPSATWEAGGSTGDFNWNYPMRVPPATAGPAPQLSIGYNSGSVDGRTSAENNQTSVVGEGFSITESYIERKYGSCREDGQTGKGDLCWKYANAALVLNGRAAELVNDCSTDAACTTAAQSEATGGTWRLKNDDATRVEHLTGAPNGDNNGEYWRITTTDGLQYYFGQHKLAGWSDHGTAADDEVTDSTWTVPVSGDDVGEPCHGASFEASFCNQAWKWNLDYVVDTHNNAMTYWYGKEQNNYAKSGVASPGTPYTRGGYLKRIDYGQRADQLFTKPAAQKVTFIYAQRCVVAGGCTSLTVDTKKDWPDVPFDMICDTGKACTGLIGPSFFTRYRLTDVNTYVWTGTGTTNRQVDNWHLDHSFPASGDASAPSLWLKSIRSTGKAGGTDAAMPPVVFYGAQMPNHVEGGDNTLRYYKWRVRQVKSESGSVITVNYSDPECISGTKMPASPDKNTLRCFPVYWSQAGGTPELDWFHKYVVTSVFQEDPTGGGDTQETYYDYAGGAGWAYADDDGMTKEKYRTWSQWRGYSKVTTTTGDETGPKGKNFTLYMRGLDGDKELDGTPRVEKVTDSTGTAIDDSRQYAGFVREVITYDGQTEISAAVNDPWSHRTASHKYAWGTTEAWLVKAGTTTSRTAISGGTLKKSTTTTYDTTYGMPTKVDESGDIAKSGDETCSVKTYVRNTAAWLVNFASRIETYAVGCGALGALKFPEDAISDLTTGYDGQAVGAAPTKGDATSAYRLSGYTAGQPVYQNVSTSTYDQLGRPVTTKDALGRQTTTAYTPSDTGYGPLTQKKVTDPKNYSATTEIDPAWGSATKLTDANGKVTEWSFDALGRLVAVWQPNRVRTLGDAASIVYAYGVQQDKATWVRTDTLKADGATYNTSYELFDSAMRPRQTQAPSPAGGRVITEKLYDDRGMAYKTNGQVHDNTAPGSDLASTLSGSVPAATETLFDGAGRPTAEVFSVYGQEKWRTSTSYSGDETAVTAAPGGSGVRTYTNSLGLVTERREYAGPAPTGTNFTSTKYTYARGGQIQAMTGPDGAKWTYNYDLRGRLISKTDPDSGTVTSTYNDNDQVLTAATTQGGVTRTILMEYDELGRKTGTWDGVKDNAHQLTKYTYDTLAKGKLTASIRYVGGTTGQIYANSVTGYDSIGRATGVRTVLAATDPLVVAGAPQTFTTSTAYNIDGTVGNLSLPAVGGLPAETVAYTYNSLGLVTGVEGMADYVRSVGYSPFGEAEQTTLGISSTAKKMQVLNRYEDGTRRLTNIHTLDETNAGHTSDIDYAYDASGNVLSVKNKAGTADSQCFAYDGYRRLTEAWTPTSNDCSTTRSAAALGGPAPYWNSWTYKVGGLRDTQTVHAPAGDTKTTYTYPAVTATGGGQPHTLRTAVTGTKTEAFAYDEAGNTTARKSPAGADQTLKWNTEGKLESLTEGAKTTQYLYNADGDLLIRRSGTENVLYLYGQELHYDPVKKTFSGQRYYAAGNGRAVRTNVGLSWLVDDHHGTASLTVDATTQAVTRRFTKPFGESRGPSPSSWPDDKGFLGKPTDSTTGLTHVGAREYDPVVGRFLTVDPVFDAEDHESLNGYAYANNTPVTMSDPTGLKPIITQEGGQADEAYLKANNAFWTGGPGGWTYNQSRVDTLQFADGSSGALITTTSYGGKSSGKITQALIKGPKPAPTTKEGEKPIRNSKGVMTWGAGEGYVDPDKIERGPLAMWQKVAIGIAAVVGLAVTAAPVLALAGQACIAAAIACAEGAADLIAGEAAGSGVTVMGVGGGTYLMGEGEVFQQVARKKTDSVDDFHDVVVHGTPHDFGRNVDSWDKGENFGHRVLANIVKNDEAWGGGPIRLLSCNTGVDGATAAQNLSNKLGVDVLAPNGYVYIYDSGRVVPRFSANGSRQEWRLFTPGGNKK